MSRVGKKSITLPDKVTVKVNGSSVQVGRPQRKAFLDASGRHHRYR